MGRKGLYARTVEHHCSTRKDVCPVWSVGTVSAYKVKVYGMREIKIGSVFQNLETGFH